MQRHKQDVRLRYWATQSYVYKGLHGKQSDSVCIGEVKEALAGGSLTKASTIFCDDLPNFITIERLCETNDAFKAALEREYWSTMTWNRQELPIAKARQLIRAGDITEESLVWAAGMGYTEKGGTTKKWMKLGDTLVLFGLAELMEDDEVGGVSTRALQRTVDESTKVRLDNSVQTTSFKKSEQSWWAQRKARKKEEASTHEAARFLHG